MYARQNQGRRLGEFRAKRQLRLLDMRYLSSIMGYITRFMTNHPSVLEKVAIALGTCSFHRQVQLLESLLENNPSAYPDLPRCIERMKTFQRLAPQDMPSWANPVELQGVRVGITTIDYELMSFLKMVFPIDGIVAPSMPSPFHDHSDADVRRSIMYEEMVIFDPVSSLEFIQDRPIGTRIEYHVLTVPFQQAHIDIRYAESLASGLRPSRIRMPSQRGGSFALPVRDTMAEDLMKDPVARKAFESHMREWHAVAKKIHKALPSLKIPGICIPLASPSD